MRRLELPVTFVRAVLEVLRTFETEARSVKSDFTLPDTLLSDRAPKLTISILDGERLYFTLRQDNRAPIVFGGVDVRHPRVRGRARRHQSVGRLERVELQQAFGAARTRTEVDVSQIAHDLSGRLDVSN